MICLQPKSKDKDKGQADDNKKDEGEKVGSGRPIPVRQVRQCSGWASVVDFRNSVNDNVTVVNTNKVFKTNTN